MTKQPALSSRARLLGVSFAAVLGVLILGPSWAWAAPNISSISGTLSNGQPITISGSSFGSGPTVVIFDDFEKGTNGNIVSTAASSAAVGQWDAVYGETGTLPIYSNATKVSGNLASRHNNANGIWYSRLEKLIGAQSKVFVSWWMRTDGWAANETSINWKSVWITGTDINNHDMVLPTFRWEGGGQYVGNDAGGFVADCNFDMNLNTWFRTWSLLTDGSGATDAVQAWYLGPSGVVNNLNATSRNIWSSGTFQRVWINGNTETAGPVVHPMFDDVYIATGNNALARVEIGNSPTYNGSTNMTILTPTSWSASSVSATVRLGSFTNSQQAYLFVIDSTGAVNATGYPVTFGGGTQPNLPPAAPGTLTVR